MAQEINQLHYTCSNERIEAVLAGLGINSSTPPNKVLAIGGSGDVAFALLSYVERVVVVDRNSAQVSLIRERAEQLKEKDYETFLEYTIRGSCDGNDDDFQFKKLRRKDYFSKEGLLDVLSSQIDRLIILEPCDILEALENEEGTYSGIYLSNVLGTLPHAMKDIPAHLKRLQQKLDSRGIGLLYLADGDQISAINLPRTKIGGLVIQETILPLGLYIDEKLTAEARKFGESVAGLPTVYRNGNSLFYT